MVFLPPIPVSVKQTLIELSELFVLGQLCEKFWGLLLSFSQTLNTETISLKLIANVYE